MIYRVAIDENHGFCSYDELKQRSSIAMGWPDFGNLTNFIGQDRSVLSNELERRSHTHGYANEEWWQIDSRHADRWFYYFLNLQPNDLVIAQVGIEAVGITQVCTESSYVYNTNNGQWNYAHAWDRVNWIDIHRTEYSAPDFRLRGICKIHPDECIRVRVAWERYKTTHNFQPC